MTITYYDNAAVTVTSELIRVGGQAYRLSELDRVWHERGRRSWSVLAGRSALLAAIAGPLVAAVLGILAAFRLDASVAGKAAVVGSSVLIGLAVGPIADLVLEYVDRSYDRGTRPLELWVRWRGRPLRLLQSRDALEFGRIYRAVQRAAEYANPPAARCVNGTSAKSANPPATRHAGEVAAKPAQRPVAAH